LKLSEFTERINTLERDYGDLNYKTSIIEKTLQHFKNSPIVVGYESKKLDLNEHLNVVKLLARVTDLEEGIFDADEIDYADLSLSNLPADADDDIDANSQNIINLATPTANAHATTKLYVDDLVVAPNKYAFKTITGIGTDVVADQVADTLTLATANSMLAMVGSDDTITFTVSHLGIEDLTDPGGDRIMFWDDSETKLDWLAVGDSIAITTTTIDTIQDIRTTADPTFKDLTLTDFASGNETIDEILDDTLHGDVLDAITVTDGGGLNITWSAGEIWDHTAKDVVVIDAEATPQACTDDAINYLYWDRSGGGTALTLSTTEPDITDDDVFVATINCASGDIFEINIVPIYSEQIPTLIGAFRDIFPSIVTEGLVVSEHAGAGAFDVDMTAGVYYSAAYGTEVLT
jgi:hypothetical protein